MVLAGLKRMKLAAENNSEEFRYRSPGFYVASAAVMST